MKQFKVFFTTNQISNTNQGPCGIRFK